VRIWLTKKGRLLPGRLTAASRRSDQQYLAALTATDAGKFLEALLRVRQAALAVMPGARLGIRPIKSAATRPGGLLRG
jgi:hypothetical protein